MKHFLTIATVLILVMVGFSCKSINFGGGVVSESTNPQEAVTGAYKKFMDAKFYHSVVKTKNAQAEVVTELDFNAPDKFWMKNTISGARNEAIAIGNDSYTRVNEGQWTKMPATQGASLSDIRNKMSEESFKAMKDFELVGKEDLNGKGTVVFKFKNTFGGESSSKMWISTASGLPLRIDTEGSYAGNKVEMSTNYDYDKETKIEAPKVD